MDIDKWFSKLLDDPVNELVQKAMDEGQIPIGYSCSYVPDVMLSVDGLFPVRMRAPGIAGTELADNYLSSVICSYTRSLLEFALDGRYDFLQGWVFAASCDHLRRLYDNLEYLRRPGFSRILDVPHKTGDAAITWYTEELQRLAQGLGGPLWLRYGLRCRWERRSGNTTDSTPSSGKSVNTAGATIPP